MSNPISKPHSQPWYREPYPWMLIGLVSSAVVASLITLAIAINNPVDMVVSEAEYQQIRDDMRPSGHEEPKSEQPGPEKPAPSKPGVDD